jgi:beta-lactamase superfamily II metal-dependent hydrolase
MKIKPKYLLLGLFIGLILTFSYLNYQTWGWLKVVFCDVGQGDAIYIRFPSGEDMLVDGGPNNRVLSCLGRQMPFYDRKIDLIVLTHPQKDHLQGLIEVINRYKIGYFVYVPVGNDSDVFKKLEQAIEAKNINLKQVYRASQIKIDDVVINTLWPDKLWFESKLAVTKGLIYQDKLGFYIDKENGYLGDINTYSIYFHVRYKQFDLLLTGDGDIGTQEELINLGILESLPRGIEVLKIPHHGAATSISDSFIKWLRPRYAIIQVGKNSYGHPTTSTIDLIDDYANVLRNDRDGDIIFWTNGDIFDIKRTKN